jgi:copper amine oxidase-like protein
VKHLYLATAIAMALCATSIAPGSADTATPAPAMSATPAPAMTPAPAPAPAMSTMPAMDFGNPPSGEVPILFNDHHVYSRPDTLRQGRVLAALVYNGTILVPLRSMFEQMGATVAYDHNSHSVTATKPGSEVQVTLGKNEVLINGESRPLDVPPMMYKGALLVPVRVISEALGAYVQWVPEQHVCVVRYIPPTPVPTPPPAPTPVPTPVPTAAPTPPPIGFAQGGFNLQQVANEFSPAGNHTTGAWTGEAGLFFGPFAITGNVRSDQYRTTHNAQDPSGNPLTQFGTIDGGTATIPVSSQNLTDWDGRLEYEILKPRIYIAGSYVNTYTNFGYPKLTGGGFGLDKLPYFGNNNLDWYGSFMYYPNIKGAYTVTQAGSPNNGNEYFQQYSLFKYDLGVRFGKRIYVIVGYNGDRFLVKQNAPLSQTHSGPYAGLGFAF